MKTPLNYPLVTYDSQGKKTCPSCQGRVRQVRYRKTTHDRILFCDSCRGVCREPLTRREGTFLTLDAYFTKILQTNKKIRAAREQAIRIHRAQLDKSGCPHLQKCWQQIQREASEEDYYTAEELMEQACIRCYPCATCSPIFNKCEACEC